MPDRLFTELLLAMQDRKDCYEAAREIAATILRNLIKRPEKPLYEPQTISFETAKVLKRFDKRAWLRYVSEHPSLQS